MLFSVGLPSRFLLQKSLNNVRGRSVQMGEVNLLHVVFNLPAKKVLKVFHLPPSLIKNALQIGQTTKEVGLPLEEHLGWMETFEQQLGQKVFQLPEFVQLVVVEAIAEQQIVDDGANVDVQHFGNMDFLALLMLSVDSLEHQVNLTQNLKIHAETRPKFSANFFLHQIFA